MPVQKLNYSEREDKLCGSINGNVGERDFDVNMVPDDCSMPLIHDEGNYTQHHSNSLITSIFMISYCFFKEPGKESKTINLNDAEQLMDIDRANTANTGALDSFSHASGTVHKRGFQIVNRADEVDGALEHKKMKLDNVVSASPGLCEITNDVRLSSKVHPISAPSVDDSTCNKPMASTDEKCVFPLDLNAVDDAVCGDIVDILPSDEDFAQAGVRGLHQEIGDDRSSEKAMLSFLSPKVGEKQNSGDSLPTDIKGSLSLSLGFPLRKEQ
jgi:hypothetical protein